MLPEWTPFDRADHVLFVREVRRALKDRAISAPDAGLVRGEVELPAPHASTWRLAPLAETCVGKDDDFWAGLVTDDLERLIGPPPRPSEQPRPPRRPRPPRSEATAAERPVTAADPLPGDLRVQIYSRGNPIGGALSLKGLVWRPLAGPLIEVAVWDLLGGTMEQTVSPRDEPLRGRDRDAILAHGRAFAVQAMREIPIERFAAEIAGAPGEIVVSNGPYLGAWMIETMARIPPDSVYLAVPVSWHHWIMSVVTSRSTELVLTGLREVANRVLAETPLQLSERLGDTVLWWPGGGRPEVVPFGPDGPALTDAMRATIAAAPRP